MMLYSEAEKLKQHNLTPNKMSKLFIIAEQPFVLTIPTNPNFIVSSEMLCTIWSDQSNLTEVKQEQVNGSLYLLLLINFTG